jgi:PIN domain nuclease of toxin-antitoxin system
VGLANALWLSPISVWGLLVSAERGRIKLDAEPRRWVTEALERTHVRLRGRVTYYWPVL